MGRRQKWQTTARIYHSNGVSKLMGKDGWCWCIRVAARCGVLLLIQHNFLSPIPNVHVRDRRSGHDRLRVLRNTPIVYKLRPAGCPYLPVAYPLLQWFSPNLDDPSSLHLQPRSPALSERRNPYAMASSPSLSPWDAKFFHLTCPQQRPLCSLLPQGSQHLPHSVHCAPIPLAADYAFTLARHFDRRIVSCRIAGR
jgi:hypothetical protein